MVPSACIRWLTGKAQVGRSALCKLTVVHIKKKKKKRVAHKAGEPEHSPEHVY